MTQLKGLQEDVNQMLNNRGQTIAGLEMQLTDAQHLIESLQAQLANTSHALEPHRDDCHCHDYEVQFYALSLEYHDCSFS